MRARKITTIFTSFLLLIGSGNFLYASTRSSVSPNSGSPAIKIDYSIAAEKNLELQYSLRWTLGRRTQRGWYLYVPLIKNTLNVRAGVKSVEFARFVANWQRRKQIRVSGVVDKSTLYSFIKFWQSRRVKPIVIAKDYQLVSAPISDFFDPTRDSELLKVEKRTYAAYKRMVAAAAADPGSGLKSDEAGTIHEDEKFLRIVSSYRSPEYQMSLRKKQPGASRAQLAFRSPHFTGRALDIYVGGEPVTTKDVNRAIQIKTPAYQWLVKNAERFGFYPYFYEPWHWEFVPENLNK